MDVDGNYIPSVKVYPSRDMLATEIFIKGVLRYCDGKPMFTVDGAPWLRKALEEPRLGYNVEPFRR
jgi:transposase-like protein